MWLIRQRCRASIAARRVNSNTTDAYMYIHWTSAGISFVSRITTTISAARMIGQSRWVYDLRRAADPPTQLLAMPIATTAAAAAATVLVTASDDEWGFYSGCGVSSSPLRCKEARNKLSSWSTYSLPTIVISADSFLRRTRQVLRRCGLFYRHVTIRSNHQRRPVLYFASEIINSSSKFLSTNFSSNFHFAHPSIN